MIAGVEPRAYLGEAARQAIRNPGIIDSKREEPGTLASPVTESGVSGPIRGIRATSTLNTGERT